MVAGCGNNVLKYILLFLNFLVFVVALAGVIVSLVFIFQPGVLEELSGKVSQVKDLQSMFSPATVRAGLYVILGASAVILVISFLGCCGAWKEIKFLLGLYATVLFIILIAEIAAFVVAILFRNKIGDGLDEALAKAKTKNSTIYADIEKTLKCCGVKEKDSCTDGSTTYKIGCSLKIQELLKKYYIVVLGICIATIIIELLLIIFSCCLCSNIGEKVA